jgi:hypothetical protein
MAKILSAQPIWNGFLRVTARVMNSYDKSLLSTVTLLDSLPYPQTVTHNLTDIVYSGHLSAHNKKGRSK